MKTATKKAVKKAAIKKSKPKPGSYAAVLQAVAYAKKINQPITWVK